MGDTRLFKFAVLLWEAYERERKKKSVAASALRWTTSKVEQLYANYFGGPLETGVKDRIVDDLPIFDIDRNGSLSVSKEKLVTFLLLNNSAGHDFVDERQFCELFTQRTSLEVESLYKLYNKKSFSPFIQCLKSKNVRSLNIKFKSTGSGGYLVSISPSGLPECGQERKLSANHSTPCPDSLRESSPGLHSPPRKQHCTQPLDSSSQPTPVPLFPVSASRLPPLPAEKSTGDKKRPNTAESMATAEPQPDFLSLEVEDFGAQTLPESKVHKHVSLPNPMHTTHEFIRHPSPDSMHTFIRQPAPNSMHTTHEFIRQPAPFQPVVLQPQRPLQSTTCGQRPPLLNVPPRFVHTGTPPRDTSPSCSQRPEIPVRPPDSFPEAIPPAQREVFPNPMHTTHEFIRQPAPNPMHTTHEFIRQPAPNSMHTTHEFIRQPAPFRPVVLQPQRPLQSTTRGQRPPLLNVSMYPPRFGHTGTPPRDTSPSCSQQPEIPVRPLPPPDSFPEAIPPAQREVFPNPDTPDELVPPAHPHFNPTMIPPSSNLSIRLTFTDARGRPDPSRVAAEKINARLNAIIDDLGASGKFVPENVVKGFKEKLVTQCYRDRCNVNLRDIRVLEEYSKIHGRIDQLIRIFCWMSPITTLYELERSLVSCENVTSFQELRIGPLIKHPLVAKFFQPPPNLKEIPEITAHQIQKTLMKFLDKARKAAAKGNKHSLEDFLEFFAKSLSKPSPHDLCVRITSFPLAIQTNFRFRRMQRESRDRVQQKIDEEIKTVIVHEVDQVRRKLASLRDPRSSVVAMKDPSVLLMDIFSVFSNYLPGYQSAKVNGFFQLLSKQEHVKQMFLLAIYRGAYNIEGIVREENRDLPREIVRQPKILHRTHGEVLDVLLQLLKHQPFPVSLSSLSAIEKCVADHFCASSFHPLTNTSFLDFLTSDVQCRSSLGGSLTVGAAPIEDGEKQIIMKIISQLRLSERSKDIVSETLMLQCGVKAVDQFHHGRIEKLINDVAEQERAKGSEITQSPVTYLAPLLVNGANDSEAYKQWSCSPLGVLGHKSKAAALDCLLCAPLLEDLAQWSHWDLVFRPQHGDLAGFIAKEGPQHGLHALELTPGTLLRIDPQASHQKFLQAVEAIDPVNTSGQLVSIVVQQGSVHEVSMQLLGNHVQTALDRLVSTSTQGSEDATDRTLQATQFIYCCLIRIPHKISHFLSKEVFLEPLRRVSSATAVEDLLKHCRGVGGIVGDKEGRRQLQSLGMGLGIKAWSDDFSAMLGEATSSQTTPELKLATSANTMVEASDSRESTNVTDTENMFASHSTKSVEATDVKTTRDVVHTQTAKTSVTVSIGPEQEAQCRGVIESIRSEEFGMGLELDGRQRQVAEKQRQREGRGLQRLSKELYSKDTHFVLELIQNADDNSYHESLFSDGCDGVPSLKFVIGPTSVTVLNNEVGFSEKNVRAICDVGRSTKGAHHSGYIGQKGIGFKSVFRVTDTPEIHSGGYHIRFDARCDAIGYILPHWIQEGQRESAAIGEGWNTTIVLPLKEDQLSMSLVRKFQDIRPSLLLFLHRLRSITVEHQASGATQFMNRSDGSEGIIQIEHNTDHENIQKDSWLVVRKQLTNASQFKTEVEVTEVALAFPLGADKKPVILAKDLHQQQVFAFLPLRSYGFRFIVQGDFDLPSSREDVNSDSVWNQFIRDEIPQLFLNALDKMKKLPGMSVTDAVAMYLQFIPLDGELHDFFKPVAIRIRNLLRGTACLPTASGSEKIDEPFSVIQSLFLVESEDTGNQQPHFWKQPSELVVVRDSHIRKYVPQSLLNSALHYFYLNPDLVPFLSPPLQAHLGVHSLSIDHLIAVAEAVLKSYSGCSQSVIMLSDDSEDDISDSEESVGYQNRRKMAQSSPRSVFVQWAAQWLACVHIILEEEGDRSPITVGKLKKIKIIPLTSGARLATQDTSLFFPSDGDSVSSAGFKCLFDEIRVVDPLLFETQGDCDGHAMVKPSHRVHSVLELLGVRDMYPAEIIKHHILPCFQSDEWKNKSTALLTTYLVYIKDSLGVQGSGVTEAEVVSLLRDCVALATKGHGLHQPAKEILHFSSQFQPTYDLEKLFPDVFWKLVSPNYLKKFNSPNAVHSWRSFLLKLGVRDVIAVKRFIETISEGSERWQELRNFVGRSPDGAYTLRDYKCSEFEDIVRSVSKSNSQRQHQQMLELVQLLDRLWDDEYRQSAYAQCYDGSNVTYLDKNVPSSFHRALKELAWLPAVSYPSGQPYNQNQLYRGRDLFDSSKSIQKLLDCHIPYIAAGLKNPKLLEMLQIRCHVSAQEVIGFLQEWSKMSTNPATEFRASIAHMTEVYIFLHRQMYQEAMGNESIKDELTSGEHGLLFVPETHDIKASLDQHVKGKFYSVHDVCWMDLSGVLYAHQKHNHDLPSDLPKILSLHYVRDDDQQKFQDLKLALKQFGVREMPKAAAYLSTLEFISSLAAIPEKHHVNDFASIALHLSQVCMKGDVTPQYLQQQLRGKKVFPSHRDQWVSSDVCLLENDNMQLASFFGECNDVHFLQWQTAKKVPRHMRIQEQQREEERKHFVDVCSIEKLSEIVKTEVGVGMGMVMPLESLRQRLHVMVPLLQRYLVANEETLYQSLLKEDMKLKLEHIFIGSVLSLECMYSIQYRGMTYHSPTRSSPGSDFTDSSEDEIAYLYVVASKIESPRCLVPTMVKIFSGRRGHFLDARNFENLVKDMLLLPITEVDSVLSDENYTFGEVDADNAWVVPYRERSEEPVVDEPEEDESVSPVLEVVEVIRDEGRSESDGLKSWPPNAPISTNKPSQHPARPPPPGSAVADIVGEDEIKKISEKYAMGSGSASRPSSRLDGNRSAHDNREHHQKQGQEKSSFVHDAATGTRNDAKELDIRSSTESQEGTSMKESKKPDEQRLDKKHHKHGVGTMRDASNSSTLPPGDEGNGKSTMHRDGRKWHETLKPGTALFAKGSCSIAEALQSIPVESYNEVPALDMHNQDSRERVGRWGEEYVYKYLNALKLLPSGGQQIESVTWVNETDETGNPYDILVQIETGTALYIEVKSTRSPGKELMEFSWNELQFASKEKQSYHLYRVYSAGSANVSLKWMENLSSFLEVNPVRLLLEL